MKSSAFMNDFISKRFQPEDLQAAIAKYVFAETDYPVPARPQINLELYAESDPEFKRELAGLLIKNIEELQGALQEAIKQINIDIFGQACHKVKTTLGMLGDQELTGCVQHIRTFVDKGDFDSEDLKRELPHFQKLCVLITEGLEEEIRSI